MSQLRPLHVTVLHSLTRGSSRSLSMSTSMWSCGHPEFADDTRVELQSCCKLVRLKRTGCWRHTVESQRSRPPQMWQSIHKLMGRGHNQTTSDLTADDFQRFFVGKVAKVRDSTADAPDPLNISLLLEHGQLQTNPL
jgi:hypothetical protein